MARHFGRHSGHIDRGPDPRRARGAAQRPRDDLTPVGGASGGGGLARSGRRGVRCAAVPARSHPPARSHRLLGKLALFHFVTDMTAGPAFGALPQVGPASVSATATCNLLERLRCRNTVPALPPMAATWP